MKTSSEVSPGRPWLTAVCERALSRIASSRARQDSNPLTRPPRRLLVVKVHGMGDSVLIRSILEKLKARNPGMRLGVLAGPATADILTLGSDFHVHIYKQRELNLRSALAVCHGIRKCRYEAVLNFEQGSTAGTAFLASTGIPIHLGFLGAERSAKAHFLSHVVAFDDRRSMWESFLALARLIDPGLSREFGPFTMRPSADNERWVADWWGARIGACENAVAFHVGSAQSMDFRRWPLERFVLLAEQLELRLRPVTFLLTGTRTERGLIDRFINEYSGHSVDASEVGNIQRTIAILTRCKLLVSNDTGIMHLGAALGVPTVGLFGPNTPRHWAPLGARATYVYDTQVPCSPCINNYANDSAPRAQRAEEGPMCVTA